jgi:DNA helicase II / ATP-dependent DNA helicase PcrA
MPRGRGATFIEDPNALPRQPRSLYNDPILLLRTLLMSTNTFEGHPALPAIVFAAPGSGKTRRIVAYALECLRRGTPGDRLVLLTFTREAGHQLQARLLDESFGTPLEQEARRVFAGTVDAYALQLVYRFKPAWQSWTLLGEQGPAAIVAKLASQRKIDLWQLFPSPASMAWETTGHKVRRFLNHLGYVYNEERGPAHMARSNTALSAAIEAYWSELRRMKRHDFGTVVRALGRLLEQEPALLDDCHQTTYLLDEGQDLNTNQLRLIETLAGPQRQVLVVGDDDQQMYAWRGSDPVNLRRSLERLGASPYTLALNYRSTVQVVEHAERLILHNAHRRFPKALQSRPIQGEPGDVSFHAFGSEEDEYDHVLSAIRAGVGTSYQRPADPEGRPHTIGFGDVLVLVRRRSPEALALIAHLRRAGVPVDATNVLNVQKHPFGKLVVACLRYLVADGHPKDRLGLKTTRSIVTQLRHHGLDLGQQARFLAAVEGFGPRLEALFARTEGMHRAFAQEIFHAFVHTVLRAGWPGRLDDEQELILGVLSTAVRDFESVTPRIGFLGLRWLVRALHQGDGLPNKSPATGEAGAVRVFTVHNAKGLEADLVILPFATQKDYPLTWPEDPATWQWNRRLDPPYREGLEEERNLFYVGMTRSRRYLRVSCCDQPSQFVAEAGLATSCTGLDTGPALVLPPARTQSTFVTTMSDLKLAHSCGHRYRIARQWGFQPGANVRFGFGSSVHLINQVQLEHLRTQGSQLPLPLYRRMLPNLIVLPYAWGRAREDLERGVRQLGDRLRSKWERETPKVLGTEVRFTIPYDRVTIVEGRSDALVQLHGDGKLWNMDLKTRRILRAGVHTANPELAWDVITQQVYHAGLQALVQSEHGREVEGSQLYFARQDVHLEVPTGARDLERAKGVVLELVDRIQAGELEAKPGKRCGDCDFCLVCRYAPEGAVAAGWDEVRELVG